MEHKVHHPALLGTTAQSLCQAGPGDLRADTTVTGMLWGVLIPISAPGGSPRSTGHEQSHSEAFPLARGGDLAAEPLSPPSSAATPGSPIPLRLAVAFLCFAENVMTRQPLNFQACFQLLGGETSAVVFRFGTAEGRQEGRCGFSS